APPQGPPPPLPTRHPSGALPVTQAGPKDRQETTVMPLLVTPPDLGGEDPQPSQPVLTPSAATEIPALPGTGPQTVVAAVSAPLPVARQSNAPQPASASNAYGQRQSGGYGGGDDWSAPSWLTDDEPAKGRRRQRKPVDEVDEWSGGGGWDEPSRGGPSGGGKRGGYDDDFDVASLLVDKPPSSNKTKIGGILVGLVVVLVAIGAIVFALGSGGGSKKKSNADNTANTTVTQTSTPPTSTSLFPNDPYGLDTSSTTTTTEAPTQQYRSRPKSTSAAPVPGPNTITVPGLPPIIVPTIPPLIPAPPR
ncbi:MAG: hypothetical protein HOQ24_11095, partial [Mycobacteriaceae bacterium]|nr:hypothetical protein [Mycobacteriaceae bacterium]